MKTTQFHVPTANESQSERSSNGCQWKDKITHNPSTKVTFNIENTRLGQKQALY